MAQHRPVSATDPVKASHADLARILGDLDDAKSAEILALKPTVAEVEQAAVWAAGEGDVLARKGHRLAGVVSGIVEIVTAGEEDEEPPRVA